MAKGYSPALLKQMVYATAPLLKNPAGFGAMSVTQWQSFANWMKSDGLITQPVQASSVVNTSLLPKNPHVLPDYPRESIAGRCAASSRAHDQPMSPTMLTVPPSLVRCWNSGTGPE